MEARARIPTRSLLLACATAALLAFVPAPADATTSYMVGSELHVITLTGQPNQISIAPSGGSYWVIETGAGIPVYAGPGCSLVLVGEVACPGVTSIHVSTEDGDDTVDLSGSVPATVDGGTGNDGISTGSGDDTLAGGVGADTLTGGDGTDSFDAGDGDDQVQARDSRGEVVVCGAGTDTVTADHDESAASDCETVDKSAAPGPPAGSGPGTDPPPAPLSVTTIPPPIPTFSRRPVEVSASGVVPFRLRCPKSAPARCQGTITFEFEEDASRARALPVLARRTKKRRRYRVARKSFSIAPGKSGVVKVKLNRRGRRGVRGRKHRRARMTLAATGPDGSVTTTTKTITLKSERRRPVRTKAQRKPRKKKGGRKR